MHHPLLIIGEAYGAEEAKASEPFVGGSGRVLRAFLRDTGFDGEYLPHPTIPDERLWTPTRAWMTNVVNIQPRPTNDIKNLCGPRDLAVPGLPRICENGAASYLRAEFAPQIERLWREVQAINPNLILSLGNTPTAVLTGSPSKITKNRGTVTLSDHCRRPDGSYIKILPTFHPAAVLRDPSLRPIVLRDLLKVKREMRSPEYARPARLLWLEPSIADLAHFYNEHLAPRLAEPWGVDIETNAGTITEIGFARPDVGIVIPFYTREKPDGNYWPSHREEREAWHIVRKWLTELRRPIFQNGLYDLNYLWSMGLRLHHDPDDTMLRWHSIQPEMKKGLGFLASLFTNEPSWKFMRQDNTTLKKEDE